MSETITLGFTNPDYENIHVLNRLGGTGDVFAAHKKGMDVPTGTRYTKAIMDFISYSGKSESIDATDMVMKGKKNNLSQPIYEWDMSSNMIGSFKIEYREDK